MYPEGLILQARAPITMNQRKKLDACKSHAIALREKVEHCTKSCAVVSNSQPVVQLQYVSFVLETTVEQ